MINLKLFGVGLTILVFFGLPVPALAQVVNLNPAASTDQLQGTGSGLQQQTSGLQGSSPQVLGTSTNQLLSQNTQSLIDTTKEVNEAKNTLEAPSSQQPKKGLSVWGFVLFGAVAGAAYGFWRWVKHLRNG